MRRIQLPAPSDLMLMLWFALMGADRLNLAEDVVPFVFTPFLALTPLVVISEWLRLRACGRAIVLPGAVRGYAAACAALIGIVAASIFVSSEPTVSTPRAVLLAAQIAGTLVVAVLVANRDDARGTLARAAVFGIAVYAVVDVVQAASMFGRIPALVHAGPVALHLETNPYTGNIPRLSGLNADPNRAGFVLVFMAFLVGTGERRTVVRRATLPLAIVLMAFTLSRSTLLALITTVATYAVLRRQPRVRISTLVAGCAVAAALAAFAVFAPPTIVNEIAPVAPLAERFSSAEGSASEHVMLLQRGLDEATASPARLALGLGYGNAAPFLQDRFPGNKYANFHSLYVSMLAESGVLALAIVLVILGGALIAGGAYRPFIAGAAAFSVFYQATTEPGFWLVLALAWCAARSLRSTTNVVTSRHTSAPQR